MLGLAQDIGLHLEPSEWNLDPQEIRSRRILWWSLYTHEKWLVNYSRETESNLILSRMAHWLGRPSHIGDDDWDVNPIKFDDFTDEFGVLPPETQPSVRAFIALVDLTVILSEVLSVFYKARCKPSIMDESPTLHEDRIIEKLESWRRTHIPLLIPRIGITNGEILSLFGATFVARCISGILEFDMGHPAFHRL